MLSVLPVQGEQVFCNLRKAGHQTAVAFVAQGVDNLDGAVGLAGAFGTEQEHAGAVFAHLGKVFRVFPEVPGGLGAGAIVTVEGPLVHVGVGQGVLAAEVHLHLPFPLFTFFLYPGHTFLLATAVDGEGPHFSPPHVQDLFGGVSEAAVDDAVFLIIAFVVASFKVLFGDQGVAVFFPVVGGAAGGAVQDFPYGCQVFSHA